MLTSEDLSTKAIENEKNTIAVFDLSLTSSSPVGGTLLKLIKGLQDDYKFIAFTDQFDESLKQTVDVIRVPLPRRPILLRYLIFYLIAPFYFKRYKSKFGSPDLIITAQGEFTDCDISRSGFCHKAYLKDHWKNVRVNGRLRRLARFINHKLNMFMEKKAFQNCSAIVVPSVGLAKELGEAYQSLPSQKIVAISNPIDLEEFKRPSNFNENEFRDSLGYTPQDRVLLFIALGDFARKGLDILFEAISHLEKKHCKVLVVGGTPDENGHYEAIAAKLNIDLQVQFVGFKKDIRPYLWASDIFIFPSAYETFSQVVFKAAAAGLPVVSTKVYGVEDFIIDGVNGKLIDRTTESLLSTLEQMLEQPDSLLMMGEKAQSMIDSYSTSHYLSRWKDVLDKVLAQKRAELEKNYAE